MRTARNKKFIIMSNMRSSSQVSVYNYPEYLNPFYEDEQHKRLRFWKIKKNKSSSTGNNGSSNKNKGNDGNLSRRGSFNLGSLRDLLPLKAFRMRKQSSSLGVNITSESPPPLRRNLVDYNREDESKYASYNPHFRNTINQNNDAFLRDASYRRSLQNMNTASDLTFRRNDRYRSTVQNGTMPHNNRYIYSGSITPTPKSRYLTDVTPRMTPGSSMNSISTNPFDDDEDDVEVAEGQISQTQVQTTSSVTKPARKKKRRAPPPPVQTTQPDTAVKSTSEKEAIELRINENGAEKKDGLDELSRLTAEFESFVKHTQDDIQREPTIVVTKIEEDTKQHQQRQQQKESSKRAQNTEKEETVKIEKVVVSLETQSAVIVETKGKGEQKEKEEIKNVEEPRAIASEIDEKDKSTESIEIVNEDLRIKEVELKIKEAREENERLSNSKNNDSSNIPKIVAVEAVEHREKSPEIVQRIEVRQLKTEERSFPEIQRLTPTPTPSSREETPDYIPLTVREKFHALRIEEDEDDLPPFVKEKKIEKVVEKKEEPVPVIKIEEREISPPKIINHVETKEPSPPKTSISKEEEKKEEEIIVKSTPAPIIAETRIVRDTTPIPLARTEIEYKLNTQGFIRTERPIKFDDDWERFVMPRKDSNSENVVLRNANSSSGNNEDEDAAPPKVPERRRSVKEIIESINRQQQKLKINQPPSPQVEKKYIYGDQRFSYTHEKPAIPSKENVLLKLQRQAEHERRINELLEDLQDFSKTNPNHQKTQKFPVTTRDTNNNHHAINPIPKPRRNV